MRRGRLLLTLCALATAVLVAVAGCGGGGGTSRTVGEGTVGDLPEGVVAQVGDRRITRAQLDRALSQQLAQMQLANQEPPKPGTEEYANARRSALSNLVATAIYEIEAKKCGTPCRVTQAEIDEQIATVKRSSFGNSEQRFKDFLRRSKLTQADADRLIRTQLQRQKIFASVTKPVRYSRAEARRYYQQNRAQYRNPELREARHILVSTRQEAQRLRAQLTNDNFAEMARRHSLDPGTKAQGGDLGVIAPGSVVPEFQKAVDHLKVGEISQPVQTQFGWHIVQVTKITPARTLSFEEARPSIVETQLQLKRQAALQNWQSEVFQGWRKKVVYASRDLLPDAVPAASGATATAPAGSP